jgi:hypothetical protein
LLIVIIEEENMNKIIALIFLLIPMTALGSVKLCKKHCSELKVEHINTIKGFLYESINSQDSNVKVKLEPEFAKAIVWLEKIYKDKNLHVLTDYQNESSNLIKAAVEFIVDVATERHSMPSPEKELERWKSVGKKVLAEYAIKNKKIKWKLELLKI